MSVKDKRRWGGGPRGRGGLGEDRKRKGYVGCKFGSELLGVFDSQVCVCVCVCLCADIQGVCSYRYVSFSLSSVSVCVRLQDVHMNTKAVDVVTLLYCISMCVCVFAVFEVYNKAGILVLLYL